MATIQVGNTWMSQEEYNNICMIYRKFDRQILYGWFDHIKSEQRKEQRDPRDLKWAYVYIGNTRMMVMIDIHTNKAYKMDGYSPTWEEWKNYRLDRWCRLHDL